MEKFKALGLSDATIAALVRKGFEEPTLIQEKIIPLLLNETIDIIGQAQTGTGKTAAFGLPIIEMIEPSTKGVQVIILTPTRELAIQVAEEINSLKGKKNLNIVPIYGGQSIELQLKRLKKGADIVVGTPGRVIDHINRKTLKLSQVSFFVLDEADEMLNMGFIDDVELILSNASKDKRMLLFSATMPQQIQRLAKKYMTEYKTISATKDQLTAHLVNQIYFEVNESDRFEALCRIIDSEHEFYGLVFCRTKLDVDHVTQKLNNRGYAADGIHGDISQQQRERILARFKKQNTNILVATDVAARGIDINDLTHVINYALPQDPESYVHRIGRTGRAGKEGTAITFVTPRESRQLLFIKRMSKAEITKKKLPKIHDVIQRKKARIKDELAHILDTENLNPYHDLAREIADGYEVHDVLAALLKHAFSDELDEQNYNEIRETKEVSVNRKGKTRLFVARGKLDGMTPKSLASLIQNEAQIDAWKIKDIRICEKFSFIVAPFEDAEIILDVFKKKARGKRPLIARAKDN